MKDMREQIAQPRKIALFKSLDSNWYMVDEVRFVKHDEHYSPLPDGEVRERPLKGYVRVSEPIDIVFASLADDSIVQKAIESLDDAEREALSELNARIAAIRAQKAQLLALTHEVAA